MTTTQDTAKAIVLTGSDVDGDTLRYTIITPPAHGSLTGTAPNLTYTPALNYNGPDSFTFKVNDGTVDSANATVSLTVTAVNNPPTVGAMTWNGPVDPVKLGTAITGTAASRTLRPRHGTGATGQHRQARSADRR